MKELIRARARELGFDACRFSSALAPPYAEHFRRWLAQGRHGTMGYLERTVAKRMDPALVLAGVRSVVSVAASYHRDGKEAGGDGQGPRGVVARYARAADYHDVLAPELATLAACIGTLGGPHIRSLWYVDTGPVLEKSLAGRAGIGFVGKHTNLVARDLGNWFVLGEILTTVDLEPDPPEPNRCGTCTRCVEACPTGAIDAPFHLDARRCISYLTIEFRGSIPAEFRSAIGDRIFGCDDCLAACPWNRFAREGRLMRQHARADLEAPSLAGLLRLDEAGFRARFADTPLLRAKRRGLLRNVCIALGNVGSPAELPDLERAAADPEPLIAEHASWAIGAIRERFEHAAR